MKIADITKPEQLRAALSAKKLSHGEAMLVVLHRRRRRLTGAISDQL